MASRGKRLLAVINYPRTFFVYLCVLTSRQKRLIEMDVKRWREIDGTNMGFFESLNWYLTYKKEFRNLIQHRFKHPAYNPACLIHFFIARILWKPMETLYIYTKDIGGGLYIQHGFSTIITAKKLGRIAEYINRLPLAIKVMRILYLRIMFRLHVEQKFLVV